MLISLFIHLSLKPFGDPTMNRLELLSLSTITTSLLLSLFLTIPSVSWAFKFVDNAHVLWSDIYPAFAWVVDDSNRGASTHSVFSSR